MKPIVHFSGLALAVFAHIGEAYAADDLRGLPVLGQERELFLQETTALRGSIGVRTWISRSEYSQNLQTNQGAVVARYEYSQSNAASGEVFFTLEDDITGAFLKGVAGLGVLSAGDFREQVISEITGQELFDGSSDGDDGDLSYASIDAGVHGFEFLDGKVRTTAFVGYQYVRESYSADGLHCNPDDVSNVICGALGPLPNPISNSVQTYDSDAQWHLFRLGVGVEADLGHGLFFEGEAVVNPVGYYRGEETQTFRPHLGPSPQFVNEGAGAYGFQLEGILSYALTENFSVGAGGRYWWFDNNRVEATVGASTSTPDTNSFKQEARSERYGLVAEAKYRF